MHPQEDREIVREVLNGKKELFALLIHRYEDKIFNYIYYMVKQKEEAEDLAQTTFVKAFFALRQYNRAYEFSTWIYTIARNVCLDYFRKRKKEDVDLSLNVTVSEDGDTEMGELIEEDHSPDPLRTILNEELRGKIEKAIERLPVKLREIVVLRHLEDCSYEEIAQIMDLPVGTVKSYLHRARKKLKEWLEEYLE
ncbi:MAG: sigma-70 family RNA polymerase sigma factor [Candidatus Atribacteria bacterium]|nr:sigma-70 family RNA polymerase sigma factor [Candidatus Atribacteria bacterium]